MVSLRDLAWTMMVWSLQQLYYEITEEERFFGPKIKFRLKTKGCHDQQKRIPKYKTKVCKLSRNLKTDDNLMVELLLFNSYIR